MSSVTTEHPTARTDVTWAAVGDEGLLYDPVGAHIHCLNATGLLVWRCCDGASTVETMIDDLAVAFDRPADEIGSAVRQLVEEFSSSGLLVGDDLPPPTAGAPPTAVPASAPAPLPLSPPDRELGPYAALDLRFAVACHGSDAIAHSLERTLASLAAPAGDGHRDPVRWTIWSDDEHWYMDDGTACLQSNSDSGIVGLVLWHLNRTAVATSDRYLILHAAALGRDGAAVVLPAVMNSGKSTLATLLVEAGYDYLTDEATAIDLDTGDIVAFPKALTLDPGTQALVPHLEPETALSAAAKWQVAPHSIRPGAAVDRLPLRHLVFPTYDADGDNELAEIATIDAVIALAANAFNLASHGGRLSDIVALIEGCTSHTLRHCGLEGPVAAIDSLW